MVNRKQIIRMAREGGIHFGGDTTNPLSAYLISDIERFFAIAYAAGQQDMRERAAGVCDEVAAVWSQTTTHISANDCADAIRTLPIEGEKE